MKMLYVDVADDFTKRELGLMYLKRMAKNQGMLFKYAYPIPMSFWMKNTYIPLDIAFLDDDGSVMQIEQMSPLSTRAIRSSVPCRYALEVNRGWFQENGIRIGSIIGGEGMNPPKIKLAQGFEDDEDDDDSNPSPNLDVMLNKTFRQILQDAHIKGKELVIFYQTKWGRVLPPKIIAPPFEFGPDEFGTHNALVTAWDNQDASWKSFLIDNILKLEPKEKPMPKPKPKLKPKNKPNLKQNPKLKQGR